MRVHERHVLAGHDRARDPGARRLRIVCSGGNRSGLPELEPNLSNERIEDLKLAVSEATTNAIDAQNRGTSDARIRVEVRLADDEVTVLIHDEGPGFEPEDIPMLPEPDHPDRLLHESGLGVHLMRLLADDASITTDGHGTDVKLTVYSSRRRNSG